jgi:acyl carrier protein
MTCGGRLAFHFIIGYRGGVKAAMEAPMTNAEKYAKVFIDEFGIEEGRLAGLNYRDVPEWDSVGHMTLIAELERVFDIMMDTDDIIDLGSFEKGKEILGKYNVEF